MSFTCPHCGSRHESTVGRCPKTHEVIGSQYKLTGTVIADRYTLTDVIGEGGMGVVFKGEHSQLGKTFAIKLLRESVAGDETTVERFIREAKAAAKVGHENIIEVYDTGKDASGQIYMVMELLDGPTLKEVLKRGSIEHPIASSIMLKVLAALEAAHAKGITHRDIKPDNVHISTTDDDSTVVKVLDFGIAKITQGDQTHGLTQTGSMIGTPHYMSPEQAQGEKGVNHRTDLYSCGVMLYEMLSGQRPFRADSHLALAMKIVHDEPTPLQELVPDIPDALAEAIHRAMAKDPAQRYQSASEFASDIQPFASEEVKLEGLMARPPSPDDPLTKSGTNLGWSATGTPGQGRRYWQWLLLGIILILAGTTAITLIMTGVFDPTTPPPQPAAAPPPAIAPTSAKPIPKDLVKFHIDADPPHAEILLDGAALRGNPVDLVLEKTPEAKILEVRAEGYDSVKEWITLNEDFSRTVYLDSGEDEPTTIADTPPTKKPVGKKVVKKGGPKIITLAPIEIQDNPLSKEIIRREIRLHINEVRHCYELELAKDPTLKGKVAVQFSIGPEGKVTSSKLASSTIDNEKVEKCIVKLVTNWTFPKPDGGSVVITYPFQLLPATEVEDNKQ